MLRFAVFCPEARGLKIKEIVQLEPGATAAVQLLARRNAEGLAPPRETEEICSDVLPELETVSV